MAFGLNQEVEKRARELIRLNKVEARGTLRIGSGIRSVKYSNDEFYRRYTRTTQTVKVKSTDKFFDGSWWSLNPGEIGAASPASMSWHNPCPADAINGDQGAVAIDWVNELAWAAKNAHRVGLIFSKIVNEGHHSWPIEYPEGRARYNPRVHKLAIFNFGYVPPVISVPTVRVLKLTVPTMKGEDVKQVQKALNQHLPVKIKEDGIFGTKTESAVRSFQTLKQIWVDGVVGPQTRDKLGL